LTIFALERGSSRKRALQGILILFLTMTLASTQNGVIRSSADLSQTMHVKDPTNLPLALTSTLGPDFSMSITPSTVRLSHDQIESPLIILRSLNGFSGAVALSLHGTLPRVGIYLPDPGVVQLSAGGAASATINILDRDPGVFYGVVLGVSGNTAHTASLTIVEAPPVVCIAPDSSTTCDETPSVLAGAGPSASSQLRVAVVLDGTPPPGSLIDGFDIALLADHSVLKPAGFDMSGTILQGSITILAVCIGGVPKNGGRCAQTDTINTIHVAAAGLFATSPFPGPLFTAIYNITGSTSTTLITFQTGCGTPSNPTSVSSGACVTIANGTTSLPPETIQAGTFSNLPSFSLGSSLAILAIQRGAQDSSTLSVNGFNEFGGNVTLSSRVSPFGPRADTSLSSVLLSPKSSTGISMLTITVGADATPGAYNITVSGDSGGFYSSVSLSLNVPQPDFVLSGTNVIASAGEQKTTNLVIVSLDTFAGNVSLRVRSPIGLDSSVDPLTVTLTVGGVAHSTLLLFPRVQGVLQVNITASSGTLSHEITVPVIVPGFGFYPGLESHALTLVMGSATNVEVNGNRQSNFNGTITLAESVAPNPGLSVTCIPSSFVINQTFSGFGVPCSMLGSTAGNYTVTMTAASGILTRSFQLSVFVVRSAPVLVQLHSKHQVSLSRHDNVALFFAGIYNPNNSTTIFATVRVFISPANSRLLSAAGSTVVTLPPLTRELNIPISVPIPSSLIGEFRPILGQYDFNVEIDWWSGITFGQTPLESTLATQGISIQGTFNLVP
jgi:hypothetical protein